MSLETSPFWQGYSPPRTQKGQRWPFLLLVALVAATASLGFVAGQHRADSKVPETQTGEAVCSSSLDHAAKTLPPVVGEGSSAIHAPTTGDGGLVVQLSEERREMYHRDNGADLVEVVTTVVLICLWTIFYWTLRKTIIEPHLSSLSLDYLGPLLAIDAATIILCAAAIALDSAMLFAVGLSAGLVALVIAGIVLNELSGREPEDASLDDVLDQLWR